MKHPLARLALRKRASPVEAKAEGQIMKRDFVLVVDDDADVRQSIEEVLSLDGHWVVGVENGEQAIGAMAVARPQLVVTDLRMPVRDGHRLIEDIRKCARTTCVPICVVSSESESAPSGVAALKKPFELAELRRTVAAMVKK